MESLIPHGRRESVRKFGIVLIVPDSFRTRETAIVASRRKLSPENDEIPRAAVHHAARET